MESNNISLTNGNNESETETNNMYYGVYIPPDVEDQQSDASNNVFKDKVEALKLIKKHKKARFKGFHFYHEAVEFAVHGSEYPLILKPTLEIEPAKEPSNVGEKPPAFRGPKSQDLVKFRKNIESGCVDIVSTTVWENPRYLISSGDTPSILHEGSRYNALHVAAKSKNRSMCELILNTVADLTFIKLLYGDDSNQDPSERAAMLVDLYLNTPDKGLNETPLHFAVKFGAVDIVELLVSYPQCDKSFLNKYGKTANMIICDRCDTTSPRIKNKIAMLLGEIFYVPVLRSEDNCIPPVIGEPFAPCSPPTLNKNILEPRMEIHAYAGPMDKQSADKFRKVWKVPSRTPKTPVSVKKDLFVKLKFNDIDKGLERLGKNLALEFDVGWKEYWAFLGGFVDLTSTDGLKLLEHYLGERFNGQSKCSSSSENDSCANENSFDNEISPTSDLCKTFAACTLNDGTFKKSNAKIVSKTSCSALESVTNYTSLYPPVFNTVLNPFLCVEKSCQVFGRRITNEILHLFELEYNTMSVLLEVQIKHLELLMTSFMEDERFVSVNFHLVHYRLGNIVGQRLREFLILEDEFAFMKQSLEHWLELFNKQFDNFSSDDESPAYNHIRQVKKSTSWNVQVQCVLQSILNTLMSNNTILHASDEDECVKVWNEAKPCSCVWNTNKARKNSLIKKRNSFNRRSAASFAKDQDKAGVEKFSDTEESKCDVRDSGSEEEDLFRTPPSTPVKFQDSSDDDCFEDCTMSSPDVFIEGDVPTKTDYVVYNAVTCAQNKLNSRDYPHIYRWRHSVSLYPEDEQKSWTSPKVEQYAINSPITPTSPTSYLNTSSECTPSKSWLRITGTNSPRSSFIHATKKINFNQ